MNNEMLKKRIMRRVYAVWFFRRATDPLVLEIAALSIAFFWLASYISFENVAENVSPMLGSPVSFADFFIAAFSATELISKILLVVTALLSALMLKDLAPAVVRIIINKTGRIKNVFQLASS